MSGRFLYFAYGSNMLTERLRARCPGAEPVAVAVAEDYRLILSLPGGGPSGKAGIVRRQSASVHGVLYELAVADAMALDAHEGPSYRRVGEFAVGGRRLVAAMTYLPVEAVLRETLAPFDWYRALVLAGALQHGLDAAHVAAIAAVAAIPDPEPERPQRLAAIAALEAAGHAELIARPD